MIQLYEPAMTASQAESMALTLRNISRSHNMAIARIEELQREVADIMHEIERPRCLYKDRAKLATQLQRVRAERRELKDWLRANRQILDYIDSDKGTNLQKWLDGFVGAARKSTADAKRQNMDTNE